MAEFDFKTATPVTAGTPIYFFGAASQSDPTPSIYQTSALTTYLATSTLAAGTITTSQPLTLTQTWNAAVVFNALKINITNTSSTAAGAAFAELQVGSSTFIRIAPFTDYNAAIPSIHNPTGGAQGQSFNIGATNAPLVFGATNDGNSYAYMTNAIGLAMRSSMTFGWTSSAGDPFNGNNAVALDTILTRDAANTLAQRNGVNAQTLRIYNTFTDASNYERIGIGWTANQFNIFGESAGTGTGRLMFLKSQNDLVLGGGDNERWRVKSSGEFYASLDNTYDIGASGANRPRTGYFGTSVITPALRIDQAPTAVGTGVKTISSAADGSTNFGHYFSINLNGTTYYIPCSSVAPT